MPANHRHPSLPQLLSLGIALGLAQPAGANVNAVTEWNAVSSGPLVAPRFGPPPQQARAAAIVQIAVHDALNSIDPRYAQYNALPAAAGAHPHAAIAAAAHRALHRLIDPMPPSQAKTDALAQIDAKYDTALAAIPDGAAKAAGLAVGVAAADAIVDRRTGDGSATPNLPYTLPAGIGVYQPTPNMNTSPQTYVTPTHAGWAQMTPFVLNSPAQFRFDAGDLFAIGSSTYAREYNEVKTVGSALVRAAAPDSEESDIARFWPGGGTNWNRVIREILSAPSLNPAVDLDLDLWEQARLFALANMAESDGLVAVMDTKYTYNFWRPITAIRWQDDGNAATAPDANWWSFMATPPYPDYPCGLPTAAGAQAEAIRRTFGTDDIAYGLTAAVPPAPLPVPFAALPGKPITRAFVSLSDATSDAVNARVYGGMHFREGCRKGVLLGGQVGRFVFQHALRPRK